MRGTKVRALKQLYRVLQQQDRPEGKDLISFRKLKKLYKTWDLKLKGTIR
jgi:hypothetical protein